MNRLRTLSTYLSATGLGILAGLVGYACWRMAILPDMTAVFRVLSPTTLTQPDPPYAAGALIGYSLALALTVTRFGLRRSWQYIAVSVIVLNSACLIAAQVSGIDFLLLPLLLSGSLSLLLAQINRLWSLDRQLAQTLFNSPTSNSNSSDLGNMRLMSGIKLLNTVLPMNEAVVFRCAESNYLEAVARFKGPTPTAQDTRRNSVWREGIKLCQRAAKSGKLVSQTVDGSNSSTVAVPLLHEGETSGVLLIRLPSEFAVDDTPLLEAVGSQFARNLKRESFSKNPASSQSLVYFSQNGSKRKLDALNVLKALTVEQRCEAGTLNQIDDGVAIAYLDGTLALVNPTLLSLANLSAERVAKFDLFELLKGFRTDIFDEPEIAVRRVLQTGVDYDGELNFEKKSQILSLRISLIRDLQKFRGVRGARVYLS